MGGVGRGEANEKRAALPAHAAGTMVLGGDLEVHRMGFGAMQLTGPGAWGEPADRKEALAVLRRAVELGVDLIDTADAYGPFVADGLIKEALYPYEEQVVIATKVGQSRPAPGRWVPIGRPEYLRQQTELNLRHLGVERIDLLQLHRVDEKVPLEDQVGELAALRAEGKVRHIGLSEVTVEQVERAKAVAPIVSVQNRYNVAERNAEPVLEHCEQHEMAFIPWFPLATGRLAKETSGVASLAAARGVTPAQLALAWLLGRSPVVLPIPGTSKVAHLEENVAAASMALSEAEVEGLEHAR